MILKRDEQIDANHCSEFFPAINCAASIAGGVAQVDSCTSAFSREPRIMNQSEEPFEAQARAVSRDLNKFRERRLADRRFQVRDTADRRAPVPNTTAGGQVTPEDSKDATS